MRRELFHGIHTGADDTQKAFDSVKPFFYPSTFTNKAGFSAVVKTGVVVSVWQSPIHQREMANSPR